MRPVESADRSKVGIYGWRKRCFYSLLLGTIVLAILSLVATFLLINAIHFNLGGLGALSIYAGGVYLRDFTEILDSLVTSHMSSRHGEQLTFEASYNLSAVVRSGSGQPSQVLHFWSPMQEPNLQEVVATATRFQVSDLRGKELFTSQGHQAKVGADVLRVLEGGVHFAGSAQTSMLRSKLGTDLMLESATRRLHVRAPSGVSIESRAADISSSCFSSLQLSSNNGQVKIRAPGIYITNLETVNLQQQQTSSMRAFNTEASPMPNSYQMCICTNGKLFAAHPQGECKVDGDNSQCR